MKKMNSKKLLAIFLLLVVSTITFGVSYAVFEYIGKGNTTNYIETKGGLLFTYNEKIDGANGIKLNNAVPMLDDVGKNLTGSNLTFDFQINSNIINTPVEYIVIAKKDNITNLKDEYVKIYLTKVTGAVETPVASVLNETNKVKTFNMFAESDTLDQTGKIIYNEIINQDSKYQQDFRLRMWLSEDIDPNHEDLISKIFSIKINIIAKSS